jgi:SAM-dependent methyltransferase
MTAPAPSTEADARLGQAQQAFDSIAAQYDDGNLLLRRMRAVVWGVLARELPPGGRLLDLGCGPGIDAVHLASRGHPVVAVDWSPQMVEETRRAAAAAGLAGRVTALHVGIHQTSALPAGPFDGIYSNFGPLNCVPDLAGVAAACAARLRPGGKLIVCVMGRLVPWEIIHDRLRGLGGRSRARRAPGAVAVGLGSHAVWTAYYTPRELYRSFDGPFRLQGYRALGLLVPPPHLAGRHRRWGVVARLLGPIEDRLAALPGLRDAGDHFVMTMTRRQDA